MNLVWAGDMYRQPTRLNRRQGKPSRIMVHYLDPEEHPEGASKERRRSPLSPAERLARLKEKNAALSGVEAIEGAREVALRKLDKRSCSRSELHAAITQRGFGEDTAREVLDRLENVGLIDDAAFARMIVHDRFHLRGTTGRAIIEELRRKGLSPEHITQALQAINADDEKQKASELAQRKAERMRGLPRHKVWNRLAGMLARKGYPPAIVSYALNDILSTWEYDETTH